MKFAISTDVNTVRYRNHPAKPVSSVNHPNNLMQIQECSDNEEMRSKEVILKSVGAHVGFRKLGPIPKTVASGVAGLTCDSHDTESP